MKPIDVLILVAALSVVIIVLYKKWKQHKLNKKLGRIGCGGSCSGCTTDCSKH